MNEIWELSTTVLIIWNNGNMTKWQHTTFFLFVQWRGWRKDGKSEKSKNLSRHCRLITKKPTNQDRDRRQGIEMNNESINHKQEDIIIINYVRR